MVQSAKNVVCDNQTDLYSLVTENELRTLLIERLQELSEYYKNCREIDYSKTTVSIDILIKYVEEIESELEPEWRLAEVTYIKF